MEQKNNPLELTEFEKYALMIYEGDAPGKYYKSEIYFELGKISKNMHAYEMLNAMFYDGIENELTRVIDDRHNLYPEFIKEADNMLRVLEALYSAMYKGGKKYGSTEYCYRVDRLQSVIEMKAKGETISNFSTSTVEYDVKSFGKKQTMLLEVTIKPGVPCVIFEEELGEKYECFEEREILVAPFCPVKVEKMELETYEMELKTKTYDSPIGKLRVTILPPERPKPLTEEEQQDKEKKIVIYRDKELQKRAMTALKKILAEAEGGHCDKEEVRLTLTKEDKEDYAKWKQAFLTVVKYRFREIALEIEAALEQANKYQAKDALDLSEQNPLYITEQEKAAMQIYGAMEPSKDLYPAMREHLDHAYGLINAVFFDGIETELTRIVDDKKEISAEMIEHSDEMMEMILSLYSAMYKYGKTMDENIKTYRIERKISADEMLRRGELISNTSTALYGYDKISFGKREMQLMEIYIQKYTPCVNYGEVLGRDYTLSTESEVLLMPGCKVRKLGDEKFEETSKEKDILRVWVSPPDMPEPLTEEELKKKEELTKVYLDGEIQEKAMRFILMLRLMCNTTKKDALKKVEQEDLDAYIQWKKAFITVARYRMREIALEIEAALEEQSKYNPEDVLELAEQGIEMINSETVGEVLKTTVTTEDKEIQTENKNIGEQ